MPVGCGVCSVGEAIVGYGGVDAAPIQQQTILIDSAGVAQNARRIDPTSGRYVLDSFGRVQGMSGVAQLVEMRAGTILDSSAVADLGLAQPSGTVTNNTRNVLTNQVNLAMKDLIGQGLIQVLRVYVEKPTGTNAWRRYFTWHDLTATGTQAGVEQKTAF